MGAGLQAVEGQGLRPAQVLLFEGIGAAQVNDDGVAAGEDWAWRRSAARAAAEEARRDDAGYALEKQAAPLWAWLRKGRFAVPT